ncbi:MAG: type IV toxin-antitoxin system AbiEi family antitoxin domain-containing protein [Candidatus Hydrogenedentes bacterium]|nr:type IV toxin-antitoxin system AbiEi family antitoxin domain-containing protein [Candidatus Hydrogenedentota bacterium]
MAKSLITKKKLQRAGVGTVFSPRDLEDLGLSYYELRKAEDRGTVERVSRGLYRLSRVEPTEHHSLALVCAQVPDAILCLLSALSYHEIGTQLPREVWIGIPRGNREPTPNGAPIRVVHFSGASLTYGVQEIKIEGVPAKVTSPARTVADCFRFRRVVGRDVALEALREALRERKATRSEILQAADACRARTVVRPYLEAMSE